jgi:hypothetical protein
MGMDGMKSTNLRSPQSNPAFAGFVVANVSKAVQPAFACSRSSGIGAADRRMDHPSGRPEIDVIDCTIGERPY